MRVFLTLPRIKQCMPLEGDTNSAAKRQVWDTSAQTSPTCMGTFECFGASCQNTYVASLQLIPPPLTWRAADEKHVEDAKDRHEAKNGAHLQRGQNTWVLSFLLNNPKDAPLDRRSLKPIAKTVGLLVRAYPPSGQRSVMMAEQAW